MLMLVINSDEEPEDGIRCDPAIDATLVVADLKTRTLYCLDQVEILGATNLAEGDITHAKRRGIGGLNRTKLARFDLWTH